jgi:hypothetical protein
MPFNFNLFELMRRVFGGWQGIIDRILPLVGLHLFLFVCLSAYFPGGMKVGILRMLVPANGRAMIERWWVDNRGNPSSYRVTTWVGQAAEGPGGRGENQA